MNPSGSIWYCVNCRTQNDGSVPECRKCGYPRPGSPPRSASPGSAGPAARPPTRRPERPVERPVERASAPQASFTIFRGTLKSWESLFTEAAEFASVIGPERLISISHSEDQNDGVVTVWYWK